jgi:hypothetical protein
MLHLFQYEMQRLEMSGAIPLLPLYAFMLWTGTTVPYFGKLEKQLKSVHSITEFIHLAKLFIYNKLLLFLSYLWKTFDFHVALKMDIVILLSQILIYL